MATDRKPRVCRLSHKASYSSMIASDTVVCLLADILALKVRFCSAEPRCTTLSNSLKSILKVLLG